ncbi:MAG TPA: glycosyltransferase [Candidatus Elarobacter sp.]
MSAGSPATGTPVVSVAMKTYQHAPYLEQAIRSVLDQSFTGFELLVTDDGSTDATPEIVRRFGDERIRYDRWTTNRGVAAAMNATVGRARGEFVAILNSDDYALPGRLQWQVAYLRAHPDVAAVFGVPLQVGESGEPVGGLGAIFDRPFTDPDAPRQAWLRRLFFDGNSLCAPTAMVRRTAWEAIGPDDVRLAHLADLDRWIRLLEAHEIRLVDQRFTAFRIRANDANAGAPRRDTRLRGAFESFEIFKRYRTFDADFLREIFAEDVAREALAPGLSASALLGEIALTGSQAWHPLFALDTLFGATRDYARFRELTGRVDAFHIAGDAR